MKKNSLPFLVICLAAGALHNFAVAQGIRGTPIGSPIASHPIPNTATAGTNSPTSEMKDGYLQTGFDKLSGFLARVVYESAISNGLAFEPRLATPVPDNIKALDGKKVAIAGFMLPLKIQEGQVTEFILLKNQMMCCYGKPPVINEWVHVKIASGVKPSTDQTITIFGTLHVSEYKENAQMLGLYRMEGEKIDSSTGS